MGGIIKKRHIPRRYTSSIVLTYGSSCTSQQFYEEFHMQLTEDNLRNLSAVFRMIDTSSQVASKYLYKYMDTRHFKKLFRAQLEIYQQISQKQEKIGHEVVSACLRNHCFAVLHKYIAIIEHINDPLAFDNILFQIAVSHSFTQEAQVAFTLHNSILHRFITHEYGRYINRRTRKALKTYLRLISGRLQYHIQQYSDINDSNEMLKAMESQKNYTKQKRDQLATFNAIYINSLETRSSDFTIVSASNVIFPGTSTGGRRTLDKKYR